MQGGEYCKGGVCLKDGAYLFIHCLLEAGSGEGGASGARLWSVLDAGET